MNLKPTQQASLLAYLKDVCTLSNYQYWF